MEYSLIAIDWDGTTASPSGEVTPRTREALAAFQDAGGQLVVCSGRPVRSIRKVAERRGLDLERAAIVGMNGGQVVDPEGTLVWEGGLNADVCRRFCKHAQGFDVVPIVMTERVSYTTDVDYPAVALEVEENRHVARQVADLAALDIAPLKIMVTRVPHVPDDVVEAIMAPFSGELVGALSLPIFLEVIRADISKGNGLRRLGLDLGRSVGVGDGFNDVPLLEAVSVGVAMGNAAAGVKACADVVTATNGEDGLARVVECVLEGRDIAEAALR